MSSQSLLCCAAVLISVVLKTPSPAAAGRVTLDNSDKFEFGMPPNYDHRHEQNPIHIVNAETRVNGVLLTPHTVTPIRPDAAMLRTETPEDRNISFHSSDSFFTDWSNDDMSVPNRPLSLIETNINVSPGLARTQMPLRVRTTPPVTAPHTAIVQQQPPVVVTPSVTETVLHRTAPSDSVFISGSVIGDNIQIDPAETRHFVDYDYEDVVPTRVETGPDGQVTIFHSNGGFITAGPQGVRIKMAVPDYEDYQEVNGVLVPGTDWLELLTPGLGGVTPGIPMVNPTTAPGNGMDNGSGSGFADVINGDDDKTFRNVPLLSPDEDEMGAEDKESVDDSPASGPPPESAAAASSRTVTSRTTTTNTTSVAADATSATSSGVSAAKLRA